MVNVSFQKFCELYSRRLPGPSLGLALIHVLRYHLSLCDGTIIPLTSGRSHRYFCCYCETEHLTVTILNSNVCTLLLRNTAGDSDFSFVIETIAFSFELKFK